MTINRRHFINTSLALGAFAPFSRLTWAQTSALKNRENAIVLELPPGENNPRNSEGSFVTLRDGRILFAYTHFYGEHGGDNAAAHIAARISSDEGKTWAQQDRILVENQGEENVMSVSLLRLKDADGSDNRIALFYVIKNGFHDCRLRMSTSTDEGETWSEPVLTIPAPGYFVTNNDRVVQLSSGRLIVPAAYHRVKTEDYHAWKSFDSRGICMFFLSDDGGATWREAKTWWALPVLSGSGLQEPGVIELRDGRLYGWCRTSTGYQWEMFSEDGGETWSAPKESIFCSPNSPLSIERIPATGDLLAVWNDHDDRYGLKPDSEKTSWGRTPLAAALSSDEGQTWKNHRLLEDDPKRGYCYTAIHFTDDSVLLAYCAGGYEGSGVLEHLRIRRVGLGWLYD